MDPEGFLRRACHACEREFKWLSSQQDSAQRPVADGGYFCPYCRSQNTEWMTAAQLEWATTQAVNEVAGPVFEEMNRNLRRSSSNLIHASVDWTPAKGEEPLEVNDMERVDFKCHPQEPIKVLDGWSGSVYCLVCGTPHT